MAFQVLTVLVLSGDFEHQFQISYPSFTVQYLSVGLSVCYKLLHPSKEQKATIDTLMIKKKKEAMWQSEEKAYHIEGKVNIRTVG